MDSKPRLTIITTETPWSDPRSYRPDCAELLRESQRKLSYFTELRDDFRDVLSEIRGSPYSHALVGLATFLGTIALLVVPTLVLR